MHGVSRRDSLWLVLAYIALPSSRSVSAVRQQDVDVLVFVLEARSMQCCALLPLRDLVNNSGHAHTHVSRAIMPRRCLCLIVTLSITPAAAASGAVLVTSSTLPRTTASHSSRATSLSFCRAA